jgi:hypothetical protein
MSNGKRSNADDQRKLFKSSRQMKAVGKTTLTFSANVNVLSVSATLPACWYHAKWKITGKYVHGNR